MTLSIAYIVFNENNLIFKASLESVINIADQIVVIDGGSTDGTLDLIDSFHSSKIQVISKKFRHELKEAVGMQRNEYLKYVTSDWVLVLDADEVLGDNGFLLTKLGEEKGQDLYDVRMEHFVWNLSLVDSTREDHFVLRRFFRNIKGLKYREAEHGVLGGSDKIGGITEVTIYHYGYTKGIWDVLKKYNTHKLKSDVHSKDYLESWKAGHLFGTYPVKPFRGEHPAPIKELIE